MRFLILSLFFVMSSTVWASVAYDKKEISIALETEPPNLNSLKSTDQVSFFVLGHTMEGLTRYDKYNKISPGVAEKWEITDKGATFYLRKNAKWSDGVAVTAKDFIFAWQQAVNPKIASEYAFILYPIKNAEAINKGKLPTTELGAKAEGDYVIKVEFEKPCGYFLGLMAFGTYMPVREDVFNKYKDAYAADHDKMVFNGPFRLAKWVHGASLRFEKNENYWNAAAIQLKAINVPHITPDPSARFNLFKGNEIAVTSLDSDTIQSAMREKLQMKNFSDGSVFYMEFNFRPGRVTANKNLRMALRDVFNPKEFVDTVIALPGNLPGWSLFPVWVRGPQSTFRKDFPAPQWKVNLPSAKAHLEKAKSELGTLPPLVLLTGESPNAVKQAEYFQQLYKSKLGLEIKIDKQIFKQRLAKMTSGEFDMVLAGWGPDYDDPLTFANLFSSWNENNRGRYKSEAYDKLVREAEGTTDSFKRMGAMAKIQQLVYEDVVVMPNFERGVVYVQSPKLKGVVRSVIGADPNYVYASVVK